jgi:hypothetical protein
VEQSPEEQDEQEPPPAPGTAWGTPLTEVLMAEKRDILRRAGFLHLGHSAGWSDWLNGRSCSNLWLHSGQTYSYIGIFDSPDYSLAHLS